MQRDAERTADNSYDEGIVVSDATPGEFIEWSETGERKMVAGTGWPKDVLVQAKKGDRLRIYGRFGDTVRGIDINGQMAFYRTVADRERQCQQYLRDEERRKEREYQKN